MKKSLFAAMVVATSTAALSQENLKPSHLVYMNPFLVQKYQQQAIDEGYVPPQIPAAVKEEAKFSYIAKHFDEFKYSPGVERLKQEISQKYALQKVQETAGTAPAFYATLSESEFRELTESPEVVTIYSIDQKNDSFFFSLTSDYSSQGEIIPWAKQQVLADDNISSSINFYIIDGHFNNASSGSEINLVYTNGGGDPGNFSINPGGDPHASSVLSIAAAQRNWSKIRGINPEQPVVHYGITLGLQQIHYSLTTISSMAEWASQFSTLNFSINIRPPVDTQQPYTNIFGHTENIGRAMRRASGRLMIAQSAGNYDMDACGVAFGYGNTAGSNDGILVVSGTDNYDQRYQQTPNPSPYYHTEKRANFGHCVETWAPGRSMTTTTGNGSIITATGTSFAAPVVAALAGRYGNATTHPIEREAYIKEAADWTGHYDGSSFNLPIYRAKYSPPYWHNIPKRLPVTGVYSISSTTNLNKLVDEKFYDGIDWNAGGGWGSIVIDLGSAKNLTGVRVMIRSSANGGTLNFAVHGGNTINVTALGVATIPNNPIAYQGSNDQFDLVPYYIPISGNYRYVMLEAYNAASWLSYSEVEVYGR